MRQNGYVVRDVDVAMASWLAMGVGPWFVMREVPQVNAAFRGDATEPLLTMAFANSGPLQIELIQQHDTAPSIYREFLDSGHEGFHHLSWWVPDFFAATAAADGAGWRVVHAGDSGGAAHFAYLELDGVTSTAIEIMELNDGTRGLAELVASAAATWDGRTEPVRLVG